MTNELSLLDSLFNDVFGADYESPVHCYSVPSVDVKENDTAYTMEMDLPGLTENDVNIELEHGTLTISSKKEETKDVTEKDKKEDKKPAEKYLIRERRSSSFTRRFTLPENVAEDSISASFKNGVLEITMQKKEIAAPRRIAIQAA